MYYWRNWTNNHFIFVSQIFLAFWIGFILLSGTIYADWAYRFVVNNEKVYIVSDSTVEAEQIDSKIGKVTKFSDREGTYSGNFSNHYPKGTEYYKIRGVNIEAAIAVKEADGFFKKADYNGPYSGRKYNWQDRVPFVIGIILLLLLFLYRLKKRNSK